VSKRKLKEVFKVKLNDEEKELAVRRPTRSEEDEAQRIYRKKYRELVDDGCFLRAEIKRVMRERNLWSDTDESEHKKLQESLFAGTKKLAKGGIRKSEARRLAVQMMQDRNRLFSLLGVQNSVDVNTAEAQAENYKFDYLVSICTVYNNDGSRVFASIEDYLDKSNEDWAMKAANTLFKLMTELDDLQNTFAENKFLRKYGYMNEKFQLVDDNGRLVDSDGRHINEDGRFIHWKDDGTFVYVDFDGNELTEDGDLKEDFVEFLDD